MLKFHILNVGHGDSVVVEFRADGMEPSFGLVDSNKRGVEVAPALQLLQRLGATRLAFIALTHPHADHFRGMYEVLQHFGNQVDNIFSFPIDREPKRLTAFATAYAKAYENAENPKDIEIATELLSILLHFVQLNERDPRWECPVGDGARMHVPAMPGVDVTLILPDARVKGEFFTAIDRGQSVLKSDRNNNLSLAIRFQYGGHQVVLGGDGTNENWMWVRKRTPSQTGKEFGSTRASAVKLPHHGSKLDCGPLVLDYLFGMEDETKSAESKRIAIISADGRSHPAPEVLKDLHRRGIQPFCTGLSKLCSGGIPLPSISSNVIDQRLVTFVAQVAEPSAKPSPCQGNITLTLDSNGQMTIVPQHNSPCGLR